MINIIGYI